MTAPISSPASPPSLPSPDGVHVFFTDAKQRISYVSPALCGFLGMQAERLVENSLAGFVNTLGKGLTDACFQRISSNTSGLFFVDDPEGRFHVSAFGERGCWQLVLNRIEGNPQNPLDERKGSSRCLANVLVVPGFLPRWVGRSDDLRKRRLMDALLRKHRSSEVRMEWGTNGEWIFIYRTGPTSEMAQLIEVAAQHLDAYRQFDRDELHEVITSQGIGIAYGEVVVNPRQSRGRICEGSALATAEILARTAVPGQTYVSEPAMLHLFEHLPEGFLPVVGRGEAEKVELPKKGEFEAIPEYDQTTIFMVAQKPANRSDDGILHLKPRFKWLGINPAVTILEATHPSLGAPFPAMRNCEVMQMPPPEIVGGFRLLEPVAQGVAAEVWKAAGSSGNIVALKRFHTRTDSDQTQQLAKLAFDLGQKDWPGVCKALGYGRDDLGWFVATDYWGGSLEKWLPRQSSGLGLFPDGLRPSAGVSWVDRLSQMPSQPASLESLARAGTRRPTLPEFVQIFVRLCDFLDLLHRRGVFHLNLHPANVLFASVDEVVLSDFGSRLHPAVLLTKQPTAPPPKAYWYASPEVLDGQTPPDERSDIYSLGATLYHLISGARHFEFSGDPRKDIPKLRNARVAAPSDISRSVPVPLAHILIKALAPNPENRYATVALLREDLTRVAKGRIPLASEEQRGQSFSAALGRHPAVALLMIVAVALLAGGSFYSITQLQRKAQSSSAAEDSLRQDVTRLATAEEAWTKEMRGMAPNLLELGLWRINQGAYDKALELTDQALKADPTLTPTRMFRAQILIIQGDFQDALAELDTYLHKGGRDPFTGALADTCRDALNNGTRPMGKFAQIFEQQGAHSFANAAMAESERLKMHYINLLSQAFKGWNANSPLVDGWPPSFSDVLKLEDQRGILFLEDGTLVVSLADVKDLDLSRMPVLPISYLSLARTGTADLSPLTKLPLRFLNISETQVEDLSPLRESKLEALMADGCAKLGDLTPISRLRLSYLSVEKIKAANLSPLSTMPLRYLNISKTPVENLAPLRGLPLMDLDLRLTLVSSLDALKGMPLRRLCFDGELIPSIEPLKGLPLVTLHTRNLHVKDLKPLKGMRLRYLTLEGCTVEDISPLSGMPLEYVDLAGSAVQELAPLKGLPVRWLRLQKSKVTSLGALSGMPLEALDISETGVSDLRVLSGGSLHSLSIQGTRVVNLEPLKRMPLQELVLSPGNLMNGPAPLKGISTLERVGLVTSEDGEKFLNMTPEELVNLYGAEK